MRTVQSLVLACWLTLGVACAHAQGVRLEADRNELELGFGRAVCPVPSATDTGTLAFWVSAPGRFGGQDPGEVYLFEGSPPRRTKSFSGRAGHGLAKEIELVRIDGELAFLMASDNVKGDAFHLYSLAGEWSFTFPQNMGRPVAIGDVDGDGSTDFCVQGEAGSLAVVDHLGEALPFAMNASLRGTLLGPVRAFDTKDAGRFLVLLEGPKPTLGIARVDGRAFEVVIDWSARPYGSCFDDIRAVIVSSPIDPSRRRIAIADSSWDWPWGHVAVGSFDAENFELLYELHDTLPISLGNATRDHGHGTLLGFDLCAVADLDGDGWPDFVASAPGSLSLPALHAFSSARAQLLWSRQEHAFPLWMGTSFAVIPDYDGDGIADILVGGAEVTPAGPRRREGGVRIHSSKTGKVLWEEIIHEM